MEYRLPITGTVSPLANVETPSPLAPKPAAPVPAPGSFWDNIRTQLGNTGSLGGSQNISRAIKISQMMNPALEKKPGFWDLVRVWGAGTAADAARPGSTGLGSLGAGAAAMSQYIDTERAKREAMQSKAISDTITMANTIKPETMKPGAYTEYEAVEDIPGLMSKGETTFFNNLEFSQFDPDIRRLLTTRLTRPTTGSQGAFGEYEFIKPYGDYAEGDRDQFSAADIAAMPEEKRRSIRKAATNRTSRAFRREQMNFMMEFMDKLDAGEPVTQSEIRRYSAYREDIQRDKELKPYLDPETGEMRYETYGGTELDPAMFPLINSKGEVIDDPTIRKKGAPESTNYEGQAVLEDGTVVPAETVAETPPGTIPSPAQTAAAEAVPTIPVETPSGTVEIPAASEIEVPGIEETVPVLDPYTTYNYVESMSGMGSKWNEPQVTTSIPGHSDEAVAKAHWDVTTSPLTETDPPVYGGKPAPLLPEGDLNALFNKYNIPIPEDTDFTNNPTPDPVVEPEFEEKRVEVPPPVENANPIATSTESGTELDPATGEPDIPDNEPPATPEAAMLPWEYFLPGETMEQLQARKAQSVHHTLLQNERTQVAAIDTAIKRTNQIVQQLLNPDGTIKQDVFDNYKKAKAIKILGPGSVLGQFRGFDDATIALNTSIEQVAMDLTRANSGLAATDIEFLRNRNQTDAGMWQSPEGYLRTLMQMMDRLATHRKAIGRLDSPYIPNIYKQHINEMGEFDPQSYAIPSGVEGTSGLGEFVEWQ